MPADDVTRTPVPTAITTPSRVKTGMGALEFTDGYPTGETAAKLRDHLDYLHGVETFMNTIQGVSTYAIREGFLGAGINDGDVLIFSELMDSRSLFLTANARSTSWASSICPMVRWCWRPPRTPWASSTTCGSAGSPTSVCPAGIAARAAATCCSPRAMTALSPRVACTSVVQPPTVCFCSAGRSSIRTRATTPPRPWPGSRRS